MNIKDILKIKGLKYWVATAVFLVVILFLDPNGLPVTLKLNREVSAYEDSIPKIEAAIQKEKENKMSISNIEEKERFGRENYYMKRDNEVIFKRR